MTPETPANSSKLPRNALILAPVALFPLVLLGILFTFRSSGVKRAVADPAIYMAQASPQVAASIGLPIQPAWPIHGRVIESAAGGNADLEILLRGCRGNGTLSEWAQRSQGKWHICSLRFVSSNHPPLQLVDPAQTHCEAE